MGCGGGIVYNTDVKLGMGGENNRSDCNNRNKCVVFMPGLIRRESFKILDTQKTRVISGLCDTQM